MNNADKWFFGFITLWVVLCAGDPDILDGITVKLMGSPEAYEQFKKVNAK